MRGLSLSGGIESYGTGKVPLPHRVVSLPRYYVATPIGLAAVRTVPSHCRNKPSSFLHLFVFPFMLPLHYGYLVSHFVFSVSRFKFFE